MLDYFGVEKVFFTVLGYPMSYIEFTGTLLYLWSVWLIAKRHILTWPVGITSVLLYMLLFYQIRLYSDTIEQVYYLGASAYGWWHWSRAPRDKGVISAVAFSRPRSLLWAGAATAALSVVIGMFMSRIHLIFPAVFPEAASFPYLDALTTVMSFTAMWLMARKKIESWIYWIVVDIIGIGLYYVKEVRFVALLYVILLVMAIKGLLEWTKAGGVRVSGSGPHTADQPNPLAPFLVREGVGG